MELNRGQIWHLTPPWLVQYTAIFVKFTIVEETGTARAYCIISRRKWPNFHSKLYSAYIFVPEHDTELVLREDCESLEDAVSVCPYRNTKWAYQRLEPMFKPLDTPLNAGAQVLGFRAYVKKSTRKQKIKPSKRKQHEHIH